MDIDLKYHWAKFVGWFANQKNDASKTSFSSSNQTHIISIHPDILREIFIILPIKDSLQCRSCCKYFLSVFDDFFWKKRVEQEHSFWNRLRKNYSLEEIPLHKNPKQNWKDTYSGFLKFRWEEDPKEPEMLCVRSGLAARKNSMLTSKLQTQMLSKTKMEPNAVYSLFFIVDWCREGGCGFGFMQKLSKQQREKCVTKSLGCFKGIINYAYYNNGHILGSRAQPCSNRELREFAKGDVVGFVLDRKEGVVEFFRNGISQAKIHDLYLTANADLFVAVDFWWPGSQMTIVECKRLDSWPTSAYIEHQKKLSKGSTVANN